MSKSAPSLSKIISPVLWVVLLTLKLGAQNQAPTIITFSPSRFTHNNAASTPITVEFDRPMEASSLRQDTFFVYGLQSGYHAGAFSFDSPRRTVTFTPEVPFHAGEPVTVILTTLIQAGNGSALPNSFQWSFTIQSSGSGNFTTDSTYATGEGPHYIGFGDWNRDAFLDVVIPHSRSHNLFSRLGLGGGILGANNTINLRGRPRPRTLTIGDFDIDRDLDFVVANEGSSSVSLVLNDSSGIFTAQFPAIPVGVLPGDISSGDLDGNGLLDVVTANSGSNSLSLLFNSGGGTFLPGVSFAAGQSPGGVFIGDFNNDGFHDLAVTSAVDNAVILFVNDGIGTFSQSGSFAVGTDPQFLLGQDFNLDGRLDLAVANRGSNSMSVLLNTGGTFAAAENYTLGQDPVSMATGDWDGDSDPDLAVTNRLSNELSVLANNGLGQFQIDSVYPTGLEPRFVNSGDLDGDGDLDLAVVNWQSNTLQWLLNESSQNQAPGQPSLLFPQNRQFVNPDSTSLRLIWQAPPDQDNDSLHFRVDVDPSPGFQSPLMTFDSQTNPTGFFPVPPVIQGTDSVSLTVSTPLPDSLYWWRVTARDRQSATPSGPRSFIVDTSPPNLDSLLLPPPAFTPNWYNTNTLPSLSFGVQFDERYAREAEFDLGALGGLRLLPNIPSGSNQVIQIIIDLTGMDDGAYPLSVTVSDSANNRARAATSISLDATPPSGTLARSPQTSGTETFVVSWDGTATDGTGSGISGMYDVRVQIDQGPWSTWLTSFTGTSSEYSGEHGHSYGFEAAAHDNVGNLELLLETPETATTVDTAFSDALPPTISHTPVATVEAGQPIDIQALIQDNVQVAEAILFYKEGGSRNYQSIAMTPIGGGVFEASITPDATSTRGINYYIRASDGANVTYDPNENWEATPYNVYIHITGVNNEGLVKETPQPGGDAQSAFRMISLPLTPDDPTPQTVLVDDLNVYDQEQWRFFRFDPVAGEYLEFPNTGAFSPGTAFWLIVREANKQVDSGPGTTVMTNQPFEIRLEQGWNDIGNPFSFPVNWAEAAVVQGNTSDIMGPYTYQGQWLAPNQVTTLLPWEGYTIFSSIPDVRISLPPFESQASQGKALANTSQTNWRIGITAICEKAVDASNYLGVDEDALTEWDSKDYLEPPPIGEYVSLRFPHEDWSKFRGDFTTDVRHVFEDGQVWQFDVATNIPESPVTLQFEMPESFPPQFQAILFDMMTHERLDLSQSREYTFMPGQESLKRGFQVIIGDDSYIDKLDLLVANIPEDFYLSQNYPNPFNAETTLQYQVSEQRFVSISVYNIMGQEVRRLVSQVREPGSYQVRWYSESADGREVGSGIYIVKFEAGSFQQTRKVLLIR